MSILEEKIMKLKPSPAIFTFKKGYNYEVDLIKSNPILPNEDKLDKIIEKGFNQTFNNKTMKFELDTMRIKNNAISYIINDLTNFIQNYQKNVKGIKNPLTTKLYKFFNHNMYDLVKIDDELKDKVISLWSYIYDNETLTTNEKNAFLIIEALRKKYEQKSFKRRRKRYY